MGERPYEALKKKNLELSALDVREKGAVCRALPVKVTLNNTHKCNLTCPLCFKQFEPGANMSYPDMPIEVFRAVAEDLFPAADEVALSVSGEPLAAGPIEEELELGGRYGVNYRITTNGVFLAVDRIRRAVLENVAYLHVSMDAARKETFERVREGARWERVLGGIRALLEERARLGRGPEVWLNFVMMRENIEELPDWVSLGAELGVDALYAEHVVVPAAFSIQSLVRHRRLGARMMEEARRRAEALGIRLHLPAPYPLPPEGEEDPPVSREEAREIVARGGDGGGDTTPDEVAGKEEPSGGEGVPTGRGSVEGEDPSGGGEKAPRIPTPQEIWAYNARIEAGPPVPCPYAWREIWIHYDGEILCCDTPTFPHRMGNVMEEKASLAWNGAPYRELRERLASGEVFAACRHCHVVAQLSDGGDSLSFVKET